MDSWSARQLERMKVGGNGPCAEFFSSYGIPMNTPIKSKYSSKVAEVYKTKIDALVEGKPWTAPAKIDVAPPSPLAPSQKVAKAAKEDDEWGWGDEETPPKKESDPRVAKYNGQRSISSADFFGEEQKTTDEDSTLKLLEDNWNRFSLAAASTAKTAAEKIKQSSSELSSKVQQKNWNEDISYVGTKISETSNKGWSLVQDYWGKAKETAGSYYDSLQNPDQPERPTQSPSSPPLQPQPVTSHQTLQETTTETPDLEDWLNEDTDEPEGEFSGFDAPKPKAKASQGVSQSDGWDTPADSDWDNWDD